MLQRKMGGVVGPRKLLLSQ
jgi:hypothetical protein